MVSVAIKNEKIMVEEGTKLYEMLPDDKADIIVAKVDNEPTELNKAVYEDCAVEFISMRSVEGMDVYRRSASFMLVAAVHDILGSNAKVKIKHSINKNYYCQLICDNVEVTDELLLQIENHMKQIATEDLPIERMQFSMKRILRTAKELNIEHKMDALKYKQIKHISLYKLKGVYSYFYGPLAISTGILKTFKLLKVNGDFILQFPAEHSPYQIEVFQPLQKLSQVFLEYANWVEVLKADTVGALNQIISDGKMGEIVRISEALHEKKISNIADIISQNKNIKIVLIAGPSSSGKTTFANRLCVQLRVNGMTPHVISIDNYFLNREDTPLDEFGNKDFEALEAIDIERFNKDLSDLLEGRAVQLPVFNFLDGRREYKGYQLQLKEDDIIVAEGIHGINEKLTATIDKKNKFKIYISALTQLNIDDHNRIHTTDTRMIRRIVRDNQFRGMNAAVTINMWPSVRRGEQKHIFPFQEEADVLFNSALVYEMCVLKQYAEPLLYSISPSMPQYSEASRLINYLECFLGLPSEEVPNNSIIREFIGGSCFRV